MGGGKSNDGPIAENSQPLVCLLRKVLENSSTFVAKGLPNRLQLVVTAPLLATNSSEFFGTSNFREADFWPIWFCVLNFRVARDLLAALDNPRCRDSR